tara:strand:+ start:106 stop:225 length:120 start_codon:yes stop_codon:yes gene_type:complete
MLGIANRVIHVVNLGVMIAVNTMLNANVLVRMKNVNIAR